MFTILKYGRGCCNNCFDFRCMSSVPIPDLHTLNEKAEAKIDFLYAFRKRTPPIEEEPHAHTKCSLAGQPKMLSDAALQFRDVLEKWEQKPERDIYKERVMRNYTY